MIHQFAEHLRKRIEDEIKRLTDVLASGGVKSIEEYRHMTGIIHGMELMSRELNDLLDAYDKE